MVLTPPKPTVAKDLPDLVYEQRKSGRWTLDADYYYIHFQNGYQMYTDPVSLEPAFTATGPSNTLGVEAESNVVIGWGFTAYMNFSAGHAKYQTAPNLSLTADCGWPTHLAMWRDSASCGVTRTGTSVYTYKRVGTHL